MASSVNSATEIEQEEEEQGLLEDPRGLNKGRRHRSHRTQKWFTLLMVTGFFVLLVTVVALWIRSISNKPENRYYAGMMASKDDKVSACDDFYLHACGGWLKSNEIPNDQSHWSRGFSVLRKENEAWIRNHIEKGEVRDVDSQKVHDFYTSCMEQTDIDKAGTRPLQPWVKEVENRLSNAGQPAEAPLTSEGLTALFNLTAFLHLKGVGVLFDFDAGADLKDPDNNMFELSQGGLGLPDRDYYLKDDKKEIREKYQQLVADLLRMLGEDQAQVDNYAKEIVAFETKIAQASLPKEDLRDPEKVYTPMSRTELLKMTPALEKAWDIYLDCLATATTPLELGNQLQAASSPTPSPTHPEAWTAAMRLNVVGGSKFFGALEALLRTTRPDVLRAYLKFHIINERGHTLSAPVVERRFNFYGRVLSGTKELRPRWKRCVDATSGALGFLIGKAYAQQRFAGESKSIAMDMISGVEAAFKKGLTDLSWMDEATRSSAADKAHAVINKVGYPDKWRDYSELLVDPHAGYFANAVSAAEFDARRVLRKVGTPVDKTEWHMIPATVNAYYNPSANEMVFPAGILQPPFFHRNYPLASNYGGMGMVMAHELTHGFDDQGSKFDKKGMLRSWWNDRVKADFGNLTHCVEQAADKFEVQPGVHLNGKLTLGENIADMGGLRLSYEAFHQALADSHQHASVEAATSVINEDHRYFLSFAQTWCTLATPEHEKLQATTDPHSNPHFRVNGPLQNFEPFAKVFHCPVGSKMNPSQKCRVW